jgi:uncharacterized protein (TIGR03435 family)
MSRIPNPTKAMDRLLYAIAFVCVIAPALQSQQATAPAQESGAQQPAFINQAVYEVVSIHRFKPDGGPMMMSWKTDPDGLTMTHSQITGLICQAYGVSNFQLSGVPDWVSSELFDLQAKMDEETMNAVHALSPEQAKLARQHMMLAMLTDRFKLAVHHETKQFPIYKLVVAKGGAKLHETKPDEESANGSKEADSKPGKGMMRMSFDAGAMLLTAEELSIDSLVGQLSGSLSSEVQNDTGLKGNYDFTLRWAPESMRLEAGSSSASGNANVSDNAAPSIFDALQEQLGLKLEMQKAPLDVIVIDHIEQPSEN